MEAAKAQNWAVEPQEKKYSGIITPCVCMYYKFWLILAIIWLTEHLQSPFLLSAVPPYTGPCLHIESVLYRYIVYVVPLCLENVSNVKY
jgi:hypothetical protein